MRHRSPPLRFDLAPVEPITAAPLAPVERPVMLQGWYDLSSIHWSYDAAIVQRLLPDGFTVDTFDGKAWIGLIPFEMRRIRLPFGPGGGLSAGRWSTFPETNVRTYIVDPAGRRGVWFCSLDVTRLVPTIVARVAYGLPYCWARMELERSEPGVFRYASSRRWPRRNVGAHTALTVHVGARIEAPTPLQLFLSARWALGSTFLGRRLWAPVDHPAWQLHHATVEGVGESLLAAAGLPSPLGDPVVLWSPGVEVRIGRPRLV